MPETLQTCMAFSRQVWESVTCLNPVLVAVHGYPPPPTPPEVPPKDLTSLVEKIYRVGLGE